MVRRFGVLIGICYAALAFCVAATLYLMVMGKLKMTLVFAAVSLFLFALSVVLNKERRIARLMSDDD